MSDQHVVTAYPLSFHQRPSSVITNVHHKTESDEKEALAMEVQGRKRRGKPKTRWKDCRYEREGPEHQHIRT